MGEDLESGIYRGEWWRSGAQEMPQWINWSSEKEVSGEEPSISGDSSVFTASSSSPPLMEFGFPAHPLVPKREKDMLEDEAPTFRSTIRQDPPAPQQFNWLSSNLGTNTTRRFQMIPPLFPANASHETCPSWSNANSSLKPCYPNHYQLSNQLFFLNNSTFSDASPENSEDRCSSGGGLFSLDIPRKPNNTKDSISEMRKASTETSTKRPRLDTPVPFTTFKVRKEKLGDRVTALQQLVSPFGKTDTASVLFEAIEYIKFLHDQVTVLSTPYMKLSIEDPDTTEENALRSRGLCLVPISTTLNVAKENTSDFWAPTFGGSYR